MNAEEPPLHLNLYGPPTLQKGGQVLKCGVNALRLLAVLALDGPRTRLQLADLLWDTTTDHALHNLRMTLYQLRRTLGSDATLIREEQGQLNLNLKKLHVDTQCAGKNTEFMTGHRTGGSENWLEWAQEQEQRHHCTTPHPQKTRRNQQALEEACHLEWQARQAIENDQFILAHQYIWQALHRTPQPPAHVFYTAAYLHDLLGNGRQAEQLARAGLACLSPQVSPACYYSIIASSHDTRGDHQNARLWHELALLNARRQNTPEQFCETVSFFVWHLNVTGDAQRTRTLAHESLQLGEFDVSTPYIRNSLGIAETNLGRLDHAFETLGTQHQHTVPSVSIISQVRTARVYQQAGQKDRSENILQSTQFAAQHTEDGRARYEWAAAALLINPNRWRAKAQQTVQGMTTADSAIVSEYQQLRARLTN